MKDKGVVGGSSSRTDGGTGVLSLDSLLRQIPLFQRTLRQSAHRPSVSAEEVAPPVLARSPSPPSASGGECDHDNDDEDTIPALHTATAACADDGEAQVDDADDFFAELAQDIHLRTFSSGDIIIEAGEAAKCVFFVFRGSVEVVSPDGDLVLATLEAGSYFGEIAVLFDTPRVATVRAVQKCLLGVLTSTDLRVRLEKYPVMKQMVLAEAAERYATSRAYLERTDRRGGAQPQQAQQRDILLERKTSSGMPEIARAMSLSPTAAGSPMSLSRRNSSLALLQYQDDEDQDLNVDMDINHDYSENFGEGGSSPDVSRIYSGNDADDDSAGDSESQAKAPSITISVSRTSETRRLSKQASEGSNVDHSQNIAELALLLPTTSSLTPAIAPIISVESPNSYISNLSLLHTAKRRASVAVWSDDRLMQMAQNAAERASSKSKPSSAISFIRNSVEISSDDIEDSASSDFCVSSVEGSEISALAPFPNFITRMIFGYFNVKELYRLRRISCTIAVFLQDVDNKFFETLDLSPWHKIVNDNLLQTVLSFCGHCIKKLSLRNCWHVTDKGIGHISKLVPLLEEANFASVWEITDTGIATLTRIATHLHSLDLSNCRKLTDSAILAILTFIPRLNSIHLSYCKNLSDASMEHETWSIVRSINMQRCTALSDAGFAFWEAAARTFALSELILADCSFLTDAAVNSIASVCPALELLSLSFCCALTEDCIPTLAAGCRSLRVLDLSFCGSAVSDNAMLALAGLAPADAGDGLTGSAGGDDRAPTNPPHAHDAPHPHPHPPPRMQHLERLSLRGCVLLTDAGVAALTALPRLALLNITQ
ncbi:hypothetical protein HDU84_005234, partial [Entophlyctis sp. JEL0112]